jgi:serine/threonine-protein kinase
VAGRRGRAPGAATAVLRTLSPDTVPFWVRARRPLTAGLLVLLALGAVLTLVLIDTGNPVRKGTGAPRGPAPKGTSSVSLARGAAHDYDPSPLGDEVEHHDETSNAVDNDPGTTWSTETYSDGLAGAQGPKPGVGLYVDAKPDVLATALKVQTLTPGWKATIYGAPPGAVPETIEDGWTEVGSGSVSKKKTTIPLDTRGTRYRYYLIWITELPPDGDHVEIGEVSLFRST